MATMESLIGLVNRIQRACTVLGDHGGGDGGSSLPTLWEALPSVAVVGGQVSTLIRHQLQIITESLDLVLFRFQFGCVLLFARTDVDFRVRASRRYWRVLLEEISSLEDLVIEMRSQFSIVFILIF